MITRLHLFSNVLTIAIVLLLWLLHSTWQGMLVWTLLLVGYLFAQLRFVIEADHIDYRMLPRDVGDEPLFPEPLQFVGASEKRAPPGDAP